MAAPAPASEASDAQRELQSIVIRQQKLLAEAARENPKFDEAQFRTSLQDIGYEFDGYIKKYPEVAAGYTAYGFLLWKIDMRRQAVSMFLKANKLDPNQALVKNQLGNYEAEEGRPLEAVNYFLAAVKLEPDEPLYHYQLGSLLHEARDDFIKSGTWTRDAVEKASFNAFKRAAELAPRRIEFCYRHAESFYDLASPDWDTALKTWLALEEKSKPGLEQETIRLHRANILLKQGKPDAARELLATVADQTLAKQKEKLIADLPENAKK